MPTIDPGAQVRTVSAALSDVGRHRGHNEDAVLERGDLGLFVVCDGMGGHNAGDVAAKLATTSILNFFEATVDSEFAGTAPVGFDHLEPPALRLLSAIRKANRDVFTISNTVQSHQGMGSTVVGAYVPTDGMIHIAHVGDSRAYRLSEGELEQLTHDHSFINDVLRMKPDIDAAHLARLPKNVITRALGMREDVEVDVRSEPVVAGDVYLLCSDGLCGVLSPEQMLEILVLNPDPADACRRLIDAANDAGSRDNISAVVIRIDGADESSEDTVDEDASELADGGEGLMVQGICATCGTALIEGSLFCVECGAPVGPADDP